MITHLAQSPKTQPKKNPKSKQQENPVIAKIAPNTKGRDFVIGDLHGCYEALEELLEKVKFDETKDRILSVGDLTDRGPQSLKCLSLLNEPWFHCTLGNHDENVIEVLEAHFKVPWADLENQEPWLFLANQGGEWLCREAANPESRTILLKALENLRQIPRLLIVGEDKDRFHIVHAAAVKSDSQLKLLTDTRIDKALSGENPLREPEALNTFRELAMLAIQNQRENPSINQTLENAEGLSRTFCGHCTTPEPIKILSHLHVDTGAGKPDRVGKIRMLTSIVAQDPDEKAISIRAGHPQMKIKSKEIAKKTAKTVKELGKKAYDLEPGI